MDLKEPLAAGFLRNLACSPENNALWVDDHYYTYSELWELVCTVYSRIPTDQIYNRIAIYCNDDVRTYAAILAVNIYGAAYVPLNNKYPVSKNRNIVALSGADLILSSVENDDVKHISQGARLEIISAVPVQKIENKELSFYKKAAQIEAYVLFTSGSTGEPKGVVISNENVNHCFEFFYRNYKFSSNERFLQASELTFDFSVFSFFMPLSTGGCCYVLPGNKIKFMKIVKMLQEKKITVLSMVPSILRFIENYMDEISLPHLKFCFLSGDALYHDLAVKWGRSMPNGEIHNFYGTTETTIVCTRYIFNEKITSGSTNGIVHLGKPFDGLDMIIVDDDGSLAEKGELAISGSQVITSYLGIENDPKFITYMGKKYYKPGDLVRKDPGGDLVFLGRADTQVKVNGYRIELGEIEFAITEITGKKCIVLSSRDEKQITQLTAYIETDKLNVNELTGQLLSVLPDHMIPKYFVAADKFNLSINGKVDKSKLQTK